jgi:endonuclease/exonuclease/phosphatase family metal-dependent hydrolase
MSALRALALLGCVALFGGGGAEARAAAPKVLKVMTYNIHVGFGMDKKLDLARIADVINEERPDLVGLQEVDRGVRRTSGVDQIAELARLTKMDYAFAPNLDYQGGKYGVAVLSRYPILAIDHRRYQNLREAERRGFLRVEVRLGRRRVHFVTTHLDYQRADGRLFEARQLLKALGEVGGPLILTGDLNDEPTGETFKLLEQGFTDAYLAAPSAGEAGGYTYPADSPRKRIDYVFVRKGDGARVEGAGYVKETLASDHRPFVAFVAVGPPR